MVTIRYGRNLLSLRSLMELYRTVGRRNSLILSLVRNIWHRRISIVVLAYSKRPISLAQVGKFIRYYKVTLRPVQMGAVLEDAALNLLNVFTRIRALRKLKIRRKLFLIRVISSTRIKNVLELGDGAMADIRLPRARAKEYWHLRLEQLQSLPLIGIIMILPTVNVPRVY